MLPCVANSTMQNLVMPSWHLCSVDVLYNNFIDAVYCTLFPVSLFTYTYTDVSVRQQYDKSFGGDSIKSSQHTTANSEMTPLGCY